ncbi:MAG: hypothetical protein P8074_05015 [Anaerolineales bacterium]
MRPLLRRSPLWSLWIVLFAALTACGPWVEKQDKPSADWSRGILLGESVTGSIGMYVEPGGRSVHLVWPFNAGDQDRLRYLQLDHNANPTINHAWKISGQVRTPRLLPAGPETMHLFWANRKRGAKDWTLYHTLIDSSGEFLHPGTALTAAEEAVGDYTLATDREFGAVVVWERSNQNALAMVHLNASGNPTGEAARVVNQGQSPSLRCDLQGNLHLVWRQDRALLYAQLVADQSDPLEPVQVAEVTMGITGDTLAGPVLGLAGDWAYVFWSVLSQSDVEAGTSTTEYVAFPIRTSPGAGQATPANRILVLYTEEHPYQVFQGALPLGQLVQPPESVITAAEAYGETFVHESEQHLDWVDIAGGASDFLFNPAAMEGDGEQMAMAVAVEQPYRLDSHLQIVTTVFSEGRYLGYNLASRTESISDHPALAIDTNGSLHLAWREGAGGRQVYYASTAPGAVASLDQVGLYDLVNTALRGGMESLVSVAMLPVISFWWIVPGLLLVVAWRVFTDTDNVERLVSWVPIALGYLIYQGIKFIFFPAIGSYVPFSAWMFVPAGAASVLRWAVPAGVILVSLLVAELVRRRYSRSSLAVYLALTVSDAILTLVFYGVNLLGAF